MKFWQHDETGRTTSDLESPGPRWREVDARVWGLGLLDRAKEDAIGRAALKAYNEHFFKCTPSMTVEEWTRIWRKAVAWWSEPHANQYSDRVKCQSCANGSGPNGCTD